MGRLIDADDLKNVFEGYSCTENPNPHFPLYMVKNDIDKAPTVEAVPVVRCKDCKHSDLPAVLTRKYGKIGTLTCHNRYSPCNNRNVNEKYFCSHGEMRTSAE